MVALRIAIRACHILRPLTKAVAPTGEPWLECQGMPFLQIRRRGLRPQEDILRMQTDFLSRTN